MTKKQTIFISVLLVVVVAIASVASFFIGRLTLGGEKFINEQLVLENKAKAEELLSSKVRLSCDGNGDFNIVVLADVHATGPISTSVQKDIRKIIDEEQPDLVLFTGDNAVCPDEETLRAALDSIVGYIEEQQIPWCHVYGNHDHEGGMSKEEMQPIYESYEYCVSKWGDKTLTGVGNYVLPIYEYESDTISNLIWCLDSGSMMSEEDIRDLIPNSCTDFSGIDYDAWGGYYDYIHADQIQWYYETSTFLEDYLNQVTPSIMAFHMPLQEIYYAWNNRLAFENWAGEKNDPIGASPINSGLFTAITQRGDVVATVSGHDHLNTFMVEYKGVMLSYSPGCSTHGYYSNDTLGSRVFKMNSSDPFEIETYVHYLYRK